MYICRPIYVSDAFHKSCVYLPVAGNEPEDPQFAGHWSRTKP